VDSGSKEENENTVNKQVNEASPRKEEADEVNSTRKRSGRRKSDKERCLEGSRNKVFTIRMTEEEVVLKYEPFGGIKCMTKTTYQKKTKNKSQARRSGMYEQRKSEVFAEEPQKSKIFKKKIILVAVQNSHRIEKLAGAPLRRMK